MSDASYVIEIASQVSGVEATSAEIDSLAASLSGSGVNAAMFDDAIAKLTGDLARASAASAAANAALAAGKAHYAELEAAAVKAAKGVEKIEAGLATAQGAVSAAQANVDAAAASGAPAEAVAKYNRELEKAQANLKKAEAAAAGLDDAKAGAAAAEAAARAYAGELDHLEREAEQAAAAQRALDKTLASTAKLQTRVNDNLGDAATNMSTFRGALGDIGGPIAEFGEKLLFPAQAFVDLNEKFGRGTAIAMVAGFGLARVVTAVVGAVVKLTAALVVGVIAIVGYSFAASNAARSLALTREAAEIATPALVGIPWAELTRATGVAEDSLRTLAKSLIAAKVSAADMPAALRAAAIAEAALGAGGADAFLADVRAGKRAVSDLAAEVEAKFGGVVARQLLGLEAQGARFKANVAGLFAFDGIDPALEGLAVLVALFDKNNTSGKAMRAALTGIMDPVIANAKAAAYVVEAFVLGLLIGAAKLYLAASPVIDAVGEMLGIDASEWTLSDVLNGAARAGELVAPVIAGVVIVLGVLGGAVLGVLAAFAAFVVGLSSINQAIGATIARLAQGAVSLGADIVAGLASGITSGATVVIAAITGVVGGAINAAKSLLGIASPSKVFASIGDDTGAGFAGGLAGQQDAAHAEIAKLTDPNAASDGGTAGTAGATSTTSTTSTATTIVIERIELPGVTDPRAFVAWLEGLALQGAAA